ncbi:hypothetical protein AVEN_146701-1 [Araneus ventricosus]|uniref:Uncharacterized protein n=1 Tax=Araneus ventricosus TaxID=182803 RepID=A0A4Y2RP66_ARAVE|nr:hypothetical protein AVEN_146701-1 [Araneus ventricosus]
MPLKIAPPCMGPFARSGQVLSRLCSAEFRESTHYHNSDKLYKHGLFRSCVRCTERRPMSDALAAIEPIG